MFPNINIQIEKKYLFIKYARMYVLVNLIINKYNF